MTRLAAVGLVLLASVAFAGPPSESAPKPVSVYPPPLCEPTTTPVVLLEGTTVPACPTPCDAPCPEISRPGLLTRRTAEPKAACCDTPPQLDAVLTRVLPVTPCVPPVCTDCGSSCADKTCGTPLFRGLMTRTARAPACETAAAGPKASCDKSPACSTQPESSCWSKFQAWATYRSCPRVVSCMQPNAYQPSVLAYVPCRNETNKGGCAANGSTGCNACGTTGPRCGSGTGFGLFDRILGSFGPGSRGGCSSCTGDGSHRVGEAGKHCHLVRDCSGAPELAGTQLVPGFRFAGAEQIRLYGTNQGLPTANPHWPVPAAEPEKPAAEKPKAETPKPMTDKSKGDEKPAEPKKPGGNPTASTAGLSVNRPFTNP